MTKAPPPPILARGRDVLSRYDVIFCDIWGVIHNGERAFDTANEALSRFRAKGGSVVLISNAPMQDRHVATLLDERGVRREAWDLIVSSGDLAARYVAARGWRAIYPMIYSFDRFLFEDIAARHVPLEEAEAIVCTGLDNTNHEKPEAFRPVLERALARGLPFVCANPDLVVAVGPRLLYCAGSIAALYEEMGGEVVWTGKPHKLAYDAALAAAERLRGGKVSRDRILAIGDSVRTDLAGAARFGIDALFTGSGIHADEIMMDGQEFDPDALAALLAKAERAPVGALPRLAW